jgi:hypothetical protein
LAPMVALNLFERIAKFPVSSGDLSADAEKVCTGGPGPAPSKV